MNVLQVKTSAMKEHKQIIMCLDVLDKHLGNFLCVFQTIGNWNLINAIIE